jgi:hypothetical protein
MSHKKLNFWGAVASIIGVPLAILLYFATQPGNVNGESHSVNSTNQSGGITANQININTPKEKGYVLRNIKYGATLVLDSPDLAFVHDPKRHVCLAPAGTPVMPTERKAAMSGIKDYWWEVIITTGDCANKGGWTEKANLSWE